MRLYLSREEAKTLEIILASLIWDEMVNTKTFVTRYSATIENILARMDKCFELQKQ